MKQRGRVNAKALRCVYAGQQRHLEQVVWLGKVEKENGSDLSQGPHHGAAWQVLGNQVLSTT